MIRVAVVGDGVAAALSAAVLARAGASVVHVPTGDGGTGLGPFGPAILAMPDWLGTGIGAAVGEVPGALPALGLGFAGWGRGDWLLPFGDAGAPLGPVRFLDVVERLRRGGQRARLADFSLATMACAAGRFASASADPRSPLSTLAPGLHYPADALADRLWRLAGVERTTPLAETDICDGRIAALRLRDGILTADLYVDATGEAARLIGRLDATWESWRGWLPCTASETRVAETAGPAPLHALNRADADGWTQVVPLAGRRVETRFTPRAATYENGLRPEAWRGNCIAIGAAAGIVEPIFGAPLLLAERAATRLAGLLPAGPDQRVEAAEHNRLHRSDHARALDAALAPWATNARTGEPLWDAARDHATDPLARRLALYRSRGHVPVHDDEMLDAADWTLLLDGQGLRPRRADPLAAVVPDAAMIAHADRVHDRLSSAARAMPRIAAR